LTTGAKIGRWLLVPCVAVLIVGLTIAGSRWVVGLQNSRCADENLVGGACVEGWQTSVAEWGIYAGVIVVSLSLAWLPGMVAPAFKRTVSVTGGLLVPAVLGVVLYMTRWPDFVSLLLLSLMFGLGGAVVYGLRMQREI
jgi:hypothetical protein